MDSITDDHRAEIAVGLDEEAELLCRAWDNEARLRYPYTKPDIRQQAHNILETLHWINRPPSVAILRLFSLIMEIGDGQFITQWAGTPSRAAGDSEALLDHKVAPVSGKLMPAWRRAVSFEAKHPPAPSSPKLSSVGARKVAEYAFGSKDRGGTIMAWRKDDNYISKIKWHREHVMPLLDALAQKDAE